MSRPPVRIAVWSGPRNISTAMLRSWENRPDTVVVDEPFYASYLLRTGIDHPGRDEVIGSQPTDPVEVVRDLSGPLPEGVSVHYSKQMAHHLDLGERSAQDPTDLPRDMGLGWSLDLHNVLLVRDPAEVVASYVHSRQDCTPEDIGLPQQERLFDYWRTNRRTPPIIDAADFLRDPEAHLRWLCEWAGIDFSERMLSWPPGPRESDGVWAPYWYDAVLGSTGFEPWAPRKVDLGDQHAAVARACRPMYELLREHRVQP